MVPNVAAVRTSERPSKPEMNRCRFRVKRAVSRTMNPNCILVRMLSPLGTKTQRQTAVQTIGPCKYFIYMHLKLEMLGRPRGAGTHLRVGRIREQRSFGLE